MSGAIGLPAATYRLLVAGTADEAVLQLPRITALWNIQLSAIMPEQQPSADNTELLVTARTGQLSAQRLIEGIRERLGLGLVLVEAVYDFGPLPALVDYMALSVQQRNELLDRVAKYTPLVCRLGSRPGHTLPAKSLQLVADGEQLVVDIRSLPAAVTNGLNDLLWPTAKEVGCDV